MRTGHKMKTETSRTLMPTFLSMSLIYCRKILLTALTVKTGLEVRDGYLIFILFFFYISRNMILIFETTCPILIFG